PRLLSETADGVVHDIFSCRISGQRYRIIKPELQFYRRMGVALPLEAPQTRHLRRLGMRNPRELFERKCSITGVPILTTYAPARPERVYCEEAYLAAVV
ncbi:MAG: hypothetical protein KDD44_05755, partial [Bdellovibrionales bacterium]|nr:hypothetical protein [Bdellovibrionales bacterium]